MVDVRMRPRSERVASSAIRFFDVRRRSDVRRMPPSSRERMDRAALSISSIISLEVEQPRSTP